MFQSFGNSNKGNIERIKNESNDNLNVVKLRSHKKKALLFALLVDILTATGSVYTIPNVRKGYIYNDWLDAETTSVSSSKNLLHMFRGNVEGTCLNDKEKFFEKYFEEMYLIGTILKSTFDKIHIPNDTGSNDNIVLKSNNIASENSQ